MYTTLKHWREAATLMLCVRNRFLKTPLNAKDVVFNMLTENDNQLSKTSTVCHRCDFDYSLLYIKRSMGSSFMPSKFVYPGGAADDSDFDIQWNDLFKKSGCNVDQILSSCVPLSGDQPANSLLRKRPGMILTPDIAFRITAIRELFEETGILLVRHFSQCSAGGKNFANYTLNKHTIFTNISSSDLQSWRQSIYKQPRMFLTFCEKYSIIPDIWSLYEWSNWLTPVYDSSQSFNDRKQGKRFDTVFYISFVESDQDLNPKHDDLEASSTQFLTPIDVFYRAMANPQEVAPPQLYENARLMNFTKYKDLSTFSVIRSKYRAQQILPVLTSLRDGFVQFFPGDELYPANPDLTGERDPPTLDIALEDLSNFPRANRRIYDKNYNSKMLAPFFYNVPTYGWHVAPVTDVQLI